MEQPRDNGHPGQLTHILCREHPIKSLFSIDHVFQRGHWVSQHIDFHWKSVKLSMECRTVSLHRYLLFLSPRHTSPTLMAECRIISLAHQL